MCYVHKEDYKRNTKHHMVFLQDQLLVFFLFMRVPCNYTTGKSQHGQDRLVDQWPHAHRMLSSSP